MSVSELTDKPCLDCGALLQLELGPAPDAEPTPTEPDEATALQGRWLVCPKCGWTAPS
jgi:hypothetical protein